MRSASRKCWPALLELARLLKDAAEIVMHDAGIRYGLERSARVLDCLIELAHALQTNKLSLDVFENDEKHISSTLDCETPGNSVRESSGKQSPTTFPDEESI